jgi:hypothetical protein
VLYPALFFHTYFNTKSVGLILFLDIKAIRCLFILLKHTTMSTENRNLQNDPDQQNESSHKDEVKNVGSESDTSHTHGHTDMTSRPSEGVVGNTHSSGISTKRSVTGSDFDGQVSSS